MDEDRRVRHGRRQIGGRKSAVSDKHSFYRWTSYSMQLRGNANSV